jgi:hypothetical protein
VFACRQLNPQGHQYGDECLFKTDCAVGLACVHDAPGCELGCCSPYCDLGQPNTCPGAADGEQCFPWFDDPVPAGFENLGVCRT